MKPQTYILAAAAAIFFILLAFGVKAAEDVRIGPQADDFSVDVTNRLAKIEAAYNRTAEGRLSLHGGKPRSAYSTNEVTGVIRRMDTYPDGYIHIQEGKKLSLPSIEMQAKGKAAKRKGAQMRESRLAKLREEIAGLDAAIADYEANPTKEGRMDYAKALIERESRQRMILRLERAQTNVVTAVITPQRQAATVVVEEN